MAEGFATIVGLDVPETSAHAWDRVKIYVQIRNAGADDTLFVKLYDADTGEQVDGWAMGDISAGITWYVGWTNLTMPNKTWNLRIEAGHIEPTPEPFYLGTLENIDISNLQYKDAGNYACSSGAAIRISDTHPAGPIIGDYGVGIDDGPHNLGSSYGYPIIMKLSLATNAGEHINLTYDAGTVLSVYLPHHIAGGSVWFTLCESPITLYIANDGSTYYDAELTQLAQKAP